jgi:flagellar motor switch protein FliG
VDYAREILEGALGGEKGGEIMDRILAGSQSLPFDFVKSSDPSQLLNFIANEHPQTIALVLSHLNPQQAATVLGALPTDQQSDIARRIATMGQTSPEVIRQVESSLREKMSSFIVEDVTLSGGVDFLVKVIQNVDRGTEKTILDFLDESAPELSDEVRKGMFLFEDIGGLDDRSIQRILRDVDSKDLTIALRGSGDELKEGVFRNMSGRAADILREEMDMSGPVRLRNVEEAQQRIVNIIRKLEEAEEIVVTRGGEDDAFV